MTRTVVSWIVVALAACGPKPSPGAPSDGAIIRLSSNVRDAQLYVDGRFVGPVTALPGGVAVEPGTHRFELRHDDYFSSYLEITVGRSERRTVAMEMAPILP
ncbi:MAG: PEGA domain-containing protein [Kofleriaceae bacterium]